MLLSMTSFYLYSVLPPPGMLFHLLTHAGFPLERCSTSITITVFHNRSSTVLSITTNLDVIRASWPYRQRPSQNTKIKQRKNTIKHKNPTTRQIENLWVKKWQSNKNRISHKGLTHRDPLGTQARQWCFGETILFKSSGPLRLRSMCGWCPH